MNKAKLRKKRARKSKRDRMVEVKKLRDRIKHLEYLSRAFPNSKDDYPYQLAVCQEKLSKLREE